MKGVIRVLVVDDSRIFRTMVEEALKGEPGIEVIGSVRNGVKALEFIKETPTDLVTLDIEMPEMDGIETLEAINAYWQSRPDKIPIASIMLSSLTHRGAETTMRALERGAFDFITKPSGSDLSTNFQSLKRQLVIKITTYATKVSFRKRGFAAVIAPRKIVPAVTRVKGRASSAIKAVVMGISTGGPKALMQIMPNLCELISVPILIVQHMPPTFTQSLASNLDKRCSYTVIEGRNGDILEDEVAYIAPGGMHMVLAENISGQLMIKTNENPPNEGCRPSANVLFESCHKFLKGDLVCVVMTGMGKDGCTGAKLLKDAGATVVIQDEESSVVWGMPGSIYERGHFDHMVDLDLIPATIREIVGNKT